MRSGEIRIHDSSLSIWEEACDDSLRGVFDDVIRALRRFGWRVGRDEQAHRRYRIISKDFRYCRHGELEAALRISGRCIEFEAFQNVVNVSNLNGGRYDIGKMKRMPYLFRKRTELTFKKLIEHLTSKYGYGVKYPKPERGPGGITGREWVERRYLESWHTKPYLGRPDWHCDGNRQTNDGHLLEQGMPVYFIGYDGRIGHGTAMYNLNNMWWVLAGKYAVYNIACFYLFAERPANLRVKRNERQRRRRLEAELASAVKRMDFARAETLKRVAYGVEPTFMIWSKKNSAYFGSMFCGYRSSPVDAGKYTKQEIEESGYKHSIECGDLVLEPVSAEAIA